MATEKSNEPTRKAATKRPAGTKKRAPRKCAAKPGVAPVAATATTATPKPAAARNGDRLTEVARTIGSTVGAIAVTAKRALSQAAGKK